MANYKEQVLEKISNSQYSEALELITANGVTFSSEEITAHVDTIIADNEKGNFDVDPGVALLKHWKSQNLEVANEQKITKHVTLMDLYNATENTDADRVVRITDSEVSYFSEQTHASKKRTFLNAVLQSNIDADISTILTKFDLGTDGRNAVVTEFLSGENKIVTFDTPKDGIDSTRKTEVLKSLLKVYGDKITTLEGNYAGYFLVESLDMLFMLDIITSDDIALVQKLNRAEFLQGINKNYRGLAKKIADNIYLNYEEGNSISAGLLEEIKLISQKIKDAEKAVTKDGFEASSAEQVDDDEFRDSPVEAAATRAFDYAEAAKFVAQKSEEDGQEYYEMNSYVKEPSSNDSPYAIHNEFHRLFRSVVLDIEGELETGVKKQKIIELTETSKDRVKMKIESELSYLKENHDVDMDNLCISYGKDNKVHIVLDQSKGFPHFKNANDCSAFDDAVIVEGLNRHSKQEGGVNELTLKNHEAASVIIDYLALFQHDLLGFSEPQVIELSE